jgi:hypothetical protein
MSNRVWLVVLTLALRDDAPASAPKVAAFSASDVSDISHRASNRNPNITGTSSFRRDFGVPSTFLPMLAQPVAAITRIYATSFADDETPIYEQGAWINGKVVGLDWADVRTVHGLALGVNLPSKYADPTAVLAGEWGSDQQAEGTITVKTPLPTCCHEVELRLRSVIMPHSITGYEILCSVSVGNPYLEIVRWNGPLNDFTSVSRVGVGCADGDTLKAVALGDTISVYKNGVKVLEGKDSNYSRGSPGIGFYENSNDVWSKLGFNSWTQFGFSRFSATDNLRNP